MKAYLFLLLFFSLGLTSVFGQTEAKKQKYVPGEIIVKFQPGVLDHLIVENQEPGTSFKRDFLKDTLAWKGIKDLKFNSLRKLLRGKDLVGKKSLGRTGVEVDVSDLADITLIKVSEETDLDILCERLRSLKSVIYAEPNGTITLTDTNPNDPAFVSNIQWSLEQVESDPNFNDRDIDAARAWDFQTGSSTVKVAVIDTGIDYHNEDLGNGIFGSGAKVVSGYDYVNNDYDPDDDAANSHGTACAGIIGALRNNTKGMAGIAGGRDRFNKGVSLYAIKVADANGGLNNATVATGIIEASVNSPYFGYACHILNLSLGEVNFSSTIRDAIRVAAQNNVVVAAAKGNSTIGQNTFFYPADVDQQWILSVGATVKNDERFGISNYGGNIDVVAPGFDIYTTIRKENGIYGSFEGTSAAAPHVAGLAALIKSSNINLHAEDVQGIIKASAEKVRSDVYTYVNGYNGQMGYGRINAGRALEMMNSPWQMTHATAIGGTIFSSTSLYTQTFTNSAGGSLNGIYNVRRHEVRKQVTVPPFSQYHAWGRGTNATTGWGNVSPTGAIHYQMGYSNVVASTVNYVTLQTYVYEVYALNNSFLGFYPTTPANVVFAFTLLGIPEFSVSIGGPSLLAPATNATWTAYAINCSASLTYHWYRKVFGAQNWTDTGITTQDYTGTIAGNTNLKVDISCGGSLKTAYLDVYLDDGMHLRAAPTSETTEEVFALSQNHPNPFSENTRISYTLSKVCTARLVLIDSFGRELNILADGEHQPGIHEVEIDGRHLPGGVYIVKLISGHKQSFIKLLKK